MTEALRYVRPECINQEDIQALVEADQFGPAFNSIAPADVIYNIWQGNFKLYKADGKGCFLVEVAKGGDNSCRLNIVRASGNFLKLVLATPEMKASLQHIARELGCKAIEAVVYSDKLAKALTRSGARREATVMVLESKNG